MSSRLSPLFRAPRLRALALALSFALASTSPLFAAGFDFESVATLAEAKMKAPFDSTPPPIPQSLQDLTYDQQRAIRFKKESALWAPDKLPFEVQFFHMGRQYERPVRIFEVVNGEPKPVPFSPDLFKYMYTPDDKPPGDLTPDLGFAGLRFHHPWTAGAYYDEIGVFQGASYFRMVGQNMHWGLSARGLAVNSGIAGVPEEFPVFTNFWVVKPATKAAASVTMYALLESKSVTGAFQFEIKPGKETVADVKCRLFVREATQRFGIAPLTSMFWYGKLNRFSVGDYRPQVHDSEGLAVDLADGRKMWMPLQNPSYIATIDIKDGDPGAFGLIQRDRNYENYQDLEAYYQSRPSLWIEPQGKWGAGRIQLVNLPTADETNDNVVAFWTPETQPKAGDVLNFAYKMRWTVEDRKGIARIVAARIEPMIAGAHRKELDPNTVRFIIDFDGLTGDPKELAKLQPWWAAGPDAEMAHPNWQQNTINGQWRASVLITRKKSDQPVGVSCRLMKPIEPKPASGPEATPVNAEVFQYEWTP